MKGIHFKEIVAVFLILLFSYTAASKFLEHDSFIFQMKLSPLSQIVNLASFLSFAVPITEVGIVIILVAGIFTAPLINRGLWASLILILSFEIYISAMLFSGKDLPCACGGIIALMSWKGHVLFNGLTIVFITVALIDFQKSDQKPSKKNMRV